MLETWDHHFLPNKKVSSLDTEQLFYRVIVALFLLLIGTKGSHQNVLSTDASVIKKTLLPEEENIGEHWDVEQYMLPVFDNSTARSVSVQRGQTAFLHCIVHNLGDKTVSWIRRKDFHILTVGTDTYISDYRFQTVRISHDNDWVLQMRFAQLKDGGIYECQVSTDPKISFFVNLTVLVAEAYIQGGPKIIVEKDSSIELICVIRNSPDPPTFVFWYHNNRMINYDSARGHISVKKAEGNTVISKLHIKDIGKSESGNYTCGPSNANPASVSLVISNGEKPAAMQHDGNCSPLNGVQTRTSLFWNLPLVFFLMSYVAR